MIELMIDYAKRFIGLPYRWGGDDPMSGYDCSGLLIECLSSIGHAPPHDMNAQGLYNYFKPIAADNVLGAGALCFYGQATDKISHVALMIDLGFVLEAGGGNSKTTSLDQAIKQNAFIRVRPFDNRKDLLAILMPRYM